MPKHTHTISLALAAVLVALPACSKAQDTPQAPDPDPTTQVTGEGLPEGWMVRFDPPRRGPAPTVKDVDYRATDGGWHLKSGPAGIYYRPADAQGAGNFTVSATISQAHSSNHEAYGIWIGGKELQSANQNYLYMVIHAQDGKYLINHRTGDARPTSIVPYTPSEAVVKESPTDGSATNTVAIRVEGDMLHFLINGTEVQVLKASEIPGFTTEGLVGLRLNHNLDVDIRDFGVSK
ncbi:MAG: hypothetical protein KC485_12360 [Gemmatimonadetes bacterium]|nr:hypothetical protein [Gemmatimonadota bacterium]MCB9505625.1 hypothetical protein [Gemmatimonadales bacterium]